MPHQPLATPAQRRPPPHLRGIFAKIRKQQGPEAAEVFLERIFNTTPPATTEPQRCSPAPAHSAALEASSLGEAAARLLPQSTSTVLADATHGMPPVAWTSSSPPLERAACSSETSDIAQSSWDSESAEVLSDRLTQTVEHKLTPTAYRIYQTLHWLAIEVAKARGYSPHVSYVVFHLPVELLAHVMDIGRSTVYRHLPFLKGRGLIAQKGLTTTVKQGNRKSGSLWSIKIRPLEGLAARLTHDDFEHEWRDLEADIESENTAYNWMRQSNPKKKKADELRAALLAWALTPGRIETPLEVTVPWLPGGEIGVHGLLDLRTVPKSQRNERVDAVASAVASHLGDPNLKFYYDMIWRLLRRYDQGEDRFTNFHAMIVRAGHDRAEGFARQPGALLTSRLKKQGQWEWVRSTPNLRVGSAPT